MVERKIELRRRQARKKKLRKLKTKLVAAKDNKERDLLLGSVDQARGGNERCPHC